MSDQEKNLHGALYIQMEWENVWQGLNFEQKCILGHPNGCALCLDTVLFYICDKMLMIRNL